MKKAKNIIALVLACVLSIGIMPLASTPVTPMIAKAAAGYGSNGKFLAPIEAPVAGSTPISNRAGLEAMKDDLRGKYHLTADIDLAGEEWVPIGDGSYSGRFAGVFDGQGHVIKNLTITGVGHGNNGLFGGNNYSEIKNIGLENTNISVTGSSNTGGLCGTGNTTISNCYNTGIVSVSATTGTANSGGLCGTGSHNITNSYNISDVSASAKSNGAVAGGICGYVAATFENCYNTGKVSASSNPSNQSSVSVGGICGFLRGSTSFKKCYNSGDISAFVSSPRFGSVLTDNAYAGGICATVMNMAVFEDCYNAGNVTSTSTDVSQAGGICAYYHSSSPNYYISNCYNTGNIASSGGRSTRIGGIVGRNNINNPVTNCYCLNLYGSEYGMLLSDAQMKSKSSFTGWDFTNVWDISSSVNGGYPYLRNVPADTGGGGSSSNDDNETQGFTFGIDTFSFSNSNYSDWNYKSYYISLGDYTKFKTYIYTYYLSNPGIIPPDIYLLQIDALRNEQWEGSCYGMAVTAALDWLGRVDFKKNYGSNTADLYHVGKPRDNQNVESGINYYFFAQLLPFFIQKSHSDNWWTNWGKSLSSLVQEVKDNELVLFNYYNSNLKKNHSVLIYGYEEVNGKHILTAYDNNEPGNEVYFTIDGNFTKIKDNWGADITRFDTISDFSIFDIIDIDGPENDMVIRYSVGNTTFFNIETALYIDSKGDFTVTNAAGETLSSRGGEIGGTMVIEDISIITRGVEDDKSETATLVFYVHDSPEFTFVSDSLYSTFEVLNSRQYANTKTVNADLVRISDQSINIIGSNVEYCATISVDKDYCNMISLSGTGASNLQILDQTNGIMATGLGVPNSITSFFEHTYINNATFSTNKDSLFIVNDSTDKTGLVNVMVSSGTDGVFDTSVKLVREAPINPFTDVKESDWFYNDVMSACQSGLINGKTETTFAPNDNLTYAEAVKLAACMHQLYTTGTITLENGSPWYQSYVDYAKTNNIISKDYNWSEQTTRAGYMEIFACALPDEALAAINTIPDGKIPDVSMSHPQAAAIYKLYRAGILQGIDAAHNCSPDSNIRRSEVAAILTRMMDSSARVEFTI